MLTPRIVFSLLALQTATAAAAPRLVFDATGPYGLALTGNTLGLAGERAGPTTADRIGILLDADLALQAPGWPPGTTDDWHLASSEATLDLPADVEVVHAELVWGGTLGDDVVPATPITFTAIGAPDASHAITPAVTAELGDYYGASADVTAFVSGPGRYRVGAVPTAFAVADAAAGWSLYVAYRGASLPLARVVVALPLSSVSTDSDTLAIDGVCIPTVVRDARLMPSVLDGDANLSGDSLRFAGDLAGLARAEARVSSGAWPADNLFGGRITDASGATDTRGTYGTANHGVATNLGGGRQGWDALTVSGASQLAGDWTSALLRTSAGTGPSDAHALIALGVSVRHRGPRLALDDFAVGSGGPIASGTVTVTATFDNAGDGAAALRFMPGALPAGVHYVADSARVAADPTFAAVPDEAAFLAGVSFVVAAGAPATLVFELDVAAASGAGALAPTLEVVNADCPAAATEPLVIAPLALAFATCGDGAVEGDETCDDGGARAGDGCDASCAIETGWDCAGAPSACAEHCGDGLIVGDEVCDDGVEPGDDGTDVAGEDVAIDGCDPTCRAVDPGWSCLGEPSECRARCGDGVVAAGAERCDDGARDDGDGCDAACAIEPGWACEGAPSACAIVCGDGLVRGDEACDDGGVEPGDGCDGACAFEPGWTCGVASDDAPTVCAPDFDRDGVADDADNCPAFPNADQSFPSAPNVDCPPYDGPRTRGGGGCDAGGSTGLWLALGALAIALLRRARALVIVAVASSAVGSAARAQHFDPHLFEPSLSPLGVLAIDATAIGGRLRPFGGLVLSLADDELATGVAGDTYQQGPLDYRFITTVYAGLALFDRIELALGLPVSVAQSIDNGVASNDAAPGDLRIQLRGRLFGPAPGGQGLGLGLALHLTAPTGGGGPFQSDGELTFTPRLALDYRAGDWLVALSLGWRFRPERTIADLTVSDELRWGLGVEAPIGVYGLALTAELDGAVSLGDSAFDDGGVAAREAPVELLGGLRWRSDGGLVLTGAVGSGLTEGYGAPDFRALFGIAWSAPRPSPFAEPIVPASKNEVKDDWHDGLPPDRGGRPVLGDAGFDLLAKTDADADADGVSLPADHCPTLPEDLDGSRDDDGCPDPDNDQDGVFDADDRCPGELETLNGNEDYDGCYDEPKPMEGKGIVDGKVELTGPIVFMPGSAELAPGDVAVLEQVVLLMRANPEVERFRIEAHSDDQGDKERTVDLTERRAATVKAWLVAHGIAADRLLPRGFGSSRPIARGEAARKQNRRVEIHVAPRGR